MKQDGIRPSEKFYTALIRATGEGQRPDQTMALLQEMKGAGLTPGVRTFNTAVGACGKVTLQASTNYKRVRGMFRKLTKC